jgi:hypothetical protein
MAQVPRLLFDIRPLRAAAIAALAFVALAHPASAYVPGNRWTATASGSAGNEGSVTTLTWSLAPDGLSIPGKGGSNLVSFFDGIFGITSGGTNFQSRPWFSLFEQSFDRWSQISGINFVYEPNDSGALSSEPGALGVRGDIRIGGQNIDGTSGTLAYTNFPNDGDIVIDTSESVFFADSNNNYRAFRNTLMHEIGHGFGLDHIESSSSAFLMEPIINTTFDGPQLDDIRGVQAFYGDAYEKTNPGEGNNTFGLATSLGSLIPGSSLAVGAAATGTQAVAETETDFVSIANLYDTDYYSFVVTQPVTLAATLTPLGGIFTQAPQGGTQSSFNASARNNLVLTVFGPNGTTELAAADNGAAGFADTLAGISLPAAGEYFVRVTGTYYAVQLYQLQLSATAAATTLAGDYNHDGHVDAADYIVWRNMQGQIGTGLAADGNANGQIDAADYNLWRTNFGNTTFTGSSLPDSAVPEPKTAAILLAAATCLPFFSSRRCVLS